MKINSKPTRKKLFLPRRGLLALLTTVIFFFMLSSISFAPTKMIDDSKLSKTKSVSFAKKASLSDSDLSETYAQSFFAITQWNGTTAGGSCTGATCTGSQNVIRIDLNTRVEIMAHMDGMNMGYHYGKDGGSDMWGTATYSTDWDVDIPNFYFGGSNQFTSASASPLVWKGIFLEVGFDNISSSTNRSLNYIDFGTMSASGPVTGTFSVLNGLVANGGTGQNGGVMHRQTVAGRETITFADDPLTFLFSAKYDYTPPGGNTTKNLEGIFLKLPNLAPTMGYAP